jgi:hypothetical protein
MSEEKVSLRWIAKSPGEETLIGPSPAKTAWNFEVLKAYLAGDQSAAGWEALVRSIRSYGLVGNSTTAPTMNSFVGRHSFNDARQQLARRTDRGIALGQCRHREESRRFSAQQNQFTARRIVLLLLGCLFVPVELGVHSFPFAFDALCPPHW